MRRLRLFPALLVIAAVVRGAGAVAAQDGGMSASPSPAPPAEIIFAPKPAMESAPVPPAPASEGIIFGPKYGGQSGPPLPAPVPDVVRKPAPPRSVISCVSLASYENALAGFHANSLSDKRVDKGLLETALASFRKHNCIGNAVAPSSLVIVDFARKSNDPRLWLIDLATGKGVDEPVVVTHGIGSDYNDDGMLDRFSNTYNSLASSPGAVRGAEVYFGKNGRSLRLDGLDPTNSEIRRRDIVVHSVSPRTRTYFRADYVAKRNGIVGTSEGCFVVEPELRDWLIDSLAGGGFLYAGASGEKGAAMIAALTAPPVPPKLPDGTQIIFGPKYGPNAVNAIAPQPAAPVAPSGTNAP